MYCGSVCPVPFPGWEMVFFHSFSSAAFCTLPILLCRPALISVLSVFHLNMGCCLLFFLSCCGTTRLPQDLWALTELSWGYCSLQWKNAPTVPCMRFMPYSFILCCMEKSNSQFPPLWGPRAQLGRERGTKPGGGSESLDFIPPHPRLTFG